MASLMVVPLSNRERGKTFIFDRDVITFGTAEFCDIQLYNSFLLNSKGTDYSSITLEIYRSQNKFTLYFRDLEHYSLRINSKPQNNNSQDQINIVDGDILSIQPLDSLSEEFLIHIMNFIDEDQNKELEGKNNKLEVGVGNIRLQFPEVDKKGNLHPRTATRFLKELVIGLYAEVPSWARIVVVSLTILIPLCILVATTIVFYGIWNYSSFSEAITLKNSAEQQIAKQMEEIEKLKKDNTNFEKVLNFAPYITQTYSRGVCLIQVAYTYINKNTNQPLRYLDHSFDKSDAINPDGSINVSFEGTGDIFYELFSGSGFVFADGNILTNRHIAQPWLQSQSDEIIINNLKGKPEIKELYAFFPGFKTRFELSVVGFSSENDVAVCRFDPEDAAIPVLPLDESEAVNNIAGTAVVLLGYPSGVDGIIEQLADEKLKQDLKRKISADDRATELSNHGYINPKVSQGHITSFTAGRIAHDAPTTEGGSGSPIFNSDGKVIGINAQIMVDGEGRPVPGANIGVPIRAALELVKTSQNSTPGK